MKLRTSLLSAIFLVAFCVGCSTPSLIQEVAASAAIVADVADPAISGYTALALSEVNCATAPGATQQIIDGCLAAALNNYQLAWKNATPQEQLLITTVITAIEGIVNEAAPAQQLTAALAQVKNPAAKAPSSSQFKKQFNAAAKAAGTKTI